MNAAAGSAHFAAVEKSPIPAQKKWDSVPPFSARNSLKINKTMCKEVTHFSGSRISPKSGSPR
jgi:hypothetical protein